MKHTKSIKRQDGTRIEIHVRFWIKNDDTPIYNVDVHKCEPGKRKFLDVFKETWEFRQLAMGAPRDGYALQQQLEHVSLEEIQAAKEELWQKLKP